MESKIINMADKIKDAEDQMLEALFGTETIADNGFSNRVVGKIRRRLWLRRLALPVAACIGGLIAFKPALALFALLSKLLTAIPAELTASSLAWVPPMQLLVSGGLLLIAAIYGLRMLEE